LSGVLKQSEAKRILQKGNKLKQAKALAENIDALFVVLPFVHPEIIFVFHDISKNGAAEENHVLTTRRIFDADFEFGEGGGVALENVFKIEFTDFLLEATRKTRIHRSTTR